LQHERRICVSKQFQFPLTSIKWTKKIQWKSMGTKTDFCQNIFDVLQKKEMHSGLEQDVVNDECSYQ